MHLLIASIMSKIQFSISEKHHDCGTCESSVKVCSMMNWSRMISNYLISQRWLERSGMTQPMWVCQGAKRKDIFFSNISYFNLIFLYHQQHIPKILQSLDALSIETGGLVVEKPINFHHIIKNAEQFRSDDFWF